jgi:hypothetical protein
MTILEAIFTYYRIICGICGRYFELSAANYLKPEVVQMLNELGWTVIDEQVMCPTCTNELTPNDDAN